MHFARAHATPNCELLYVREAVQAYRSGLHRAAVILAWTAVAFDVISKLRELATHGDAGATAFVTELDAAIAANDVVKLQQIENRLLDLAQSPFEMISARERQDLDRLKEDRNACAHPAFIAGGTLLFSPSPELVRTHVVHAITHLLQHPPVQGKAALDRLKHDLLQPSFPRDQGQATTFMRTKYLSRLKPALVESLVTIFLKVLLRDADPDLAKRPGAILRALVAVREHDDKVFSRKMAADLPRVADGTDDAHLLMLVRVVGLEPRAWNWLDEPTRLRLRAALAGHAFTATDWDRLRFGLKAPDLHDVVRDAFRRLPEADQVTVLTTHPRPELAGEAARILRTAGGFRHTESVVERIVVPMSVELTPNQLREVLDAVRANGQAWDAGGMPDLIGRVFDATRPLHAETRTAWQDFLADMNDKRARGISGLSRGYDELEAKMVAAAMWPPP